MKRITGGTSYKVIKFLLKNIGHDLLPKITPNERFCINIEGEFMRAVLYCVLESCNEYGFYPRDTGTKGLLLGALTASIE